MNELVEIIFIHEIQIWKTKTLSIVYKKCDVEIYNKYSLVNFENCFYVFNEDSDF